MQGPEDRPPKVRVMDKRRVLDEQEAASLEAASDPEVEEAAPLEAASDPDVESATQEAAEEVARAERDLLDDLRRLQAEFDNYRKRMLREQTAMASRASARLVERLLPVLDNFERAVAHGEGGEGVQLVYKELRRALEQEGLAEIEAEGALFDPRYHEAFQAVDDPDTAEARVRTVFRRGYTLGDRVLRPAMVVVARPPENTDAEQADAAKETEGEG
jgi:molecular chaperone GrpE